MTFNSPFAKPTYRLDDRACKARHLERMERYGYASVAEYRPQNSPLFDFWDSDPRL